MFRWELLTPLQVLIDDGNAPLVVPLLCKILHTPLAISQKFRPSRGKMWDPSSSPSSAPSRPAICEILCTSLINTILDCCFGLTNAKKHFSQQSGPRHSPWKTKTHGFALFTLKVRKSTPTRFCTLHAKFNHGLGQLASYCTVVNV